MYFKWKQSLLNETTLIYGHLTVKQSMLVIPKWSGGFSVVSYAMMYD